MPPPMPDAAHAVNPDAQRKPDDPKPGPSGGVVLERMLDRLLASLTSGPSLNCRPHRSRQRLDWSWLSRLDDVAPVDALRELLSETAEVKLTARVTAPKRVLKAKGRGRFKKKGPEQAESTSEAPASSESAHEAEQPLDPAEQAWMDQSALITKLRIIADDARTYEQDTGVAVLEVGFPILSLPPGSFSGRQGATKRVLAPIAFVPVTVSIGGGTSQTVTIACRGEGLDRVTPNAALFAWLEQQTGKTIEDLFEDQDGADPWREIGELVRHVCKTLQLEVPPEFQLAEPIETIVQTSTTPTPTEALSNQAVVGSEGTEANSDESLAIAPLDPTPQAKTAYIASPVHTTDISIAPCPRADDEESESKAAVVACAVFGLFPMANQGLLRDMQIMAGGTEPLSGPVQSFVEVGVGLSGDDEILQPADARTVERPRVFAEERLVTAADPCQSRAVRLARQSRGLVVHGPPGTGKSQTITNIIGDHLARGQRVLLVCDKRTALDVVSDRLDHMGVGGLCALIHDPQRDQRELYRAIREQLEALPEAGSDPRAEGRVAKIDAELQKLHAELTDYRASVMGRRDGQDDSFHDLVGHWLRLASPQLLENGVAWDGSARVDESKLATSSITEVEHRSAEIRDLLDRAARVSYVNNPWTTAAGQPLGEFLSRPMESVRSAMTATADAAAALDASADPSIPPFPAGEELARHAQARATLAAQLHEVMTRVGPAVRARWAGPPRELSLSGDLPTAPPSGAPTLESMRQARQRLRDSDTFLKQLQVGPLDPELLVSLAGKPPELVDLTGQLAALTAYVEVARKWWSFFAFKQKSAAQAALNRYGLTLSPENGERLRNFLTALRARLVLRGLASELLPAQPLPVLPADQELSKSITDHIAALDVLLHASAEPQLTPLVPLVIGALSDVSYAPTVINGLRRSEARAAALMKLEQSIATSKLFDAKWASDFSAKARAGEKSAHKVDELASRLDSLEGVLRVRTGLTTLPTTLRSAVEQLVQQSPVPDEGINALRRDMLAVEIGRRLSSDSKLQGIDGQRLKANFDRYRELDKQKKSLVRDAVLHRWTDLAQKRLLAATGSRLNSLGADLKRRLTMRGERAMRLRQVLAVGRNIDGGDPIFDLRPVWMASPETVAQIFPREPIFDVVVFDEASQCRLEEALPVLIRGKRVTIAGDPKQLPPTRFFESAVAQSEDDFDEVETDQQLFEIQQAETEDLLGAALGLDIQQCYLDVHYRSKSADLIEFSNQHFYGSRLQAIPGHPKNRGLWPPVTLERVDGMYDKRRNEAEADRVCELVRELLDCKDPPSIGIACFNLRQRDLIVERLDELAEEDAKFAKRLETARTRRGAGSFEGLFVKNLENVQGDERDHIIISTTYGPNSSGKFYQQFGPLGRAGGGRRLNVLVTRARKQVHIVTSIPREVYRALPPVPAGQTPGGGWLLFAYLQYAEKLAETYPFARESDAESGQPSTKSVEVSSEADQAVLSSDPQADAPTSPMKQAPLPGQVIENPTRTPSELARSLAEKLSAARGIGSDVHWGNEGFCVDVAIHDEADPKQGVTVGVLCDASRFNGSEDPVEWDIFRTGVLESQGWTLHRLWSPHFFRDPRGAATKILAEAGDRSNAAADEGTIALK